MPANDERVRSRKLHYVIGERGHVLLRQGVRRHGGAWAEFLRIDEVVDQPLAGAFPAHSIEGRAELLARAIGDVAHAAPVVLIDDGSFRDGLGRMEKAAGVGGVEFGNEGGEVVQLRGGQLDGTPVEVFGCWVGRYSNPWPFAAVAGSASGAIVGGVIGGVLAGSR